MTEKEKQIKMDGFFKKGIVPSKQVVFLRKDLADKLKYLASQNIMKQKISTADLLNNIVEHFLEKHKEDLEIFIKKCQEEGSKILNL